MMALINCFKVVPEYVNFRSVYFEECTKIHSKLLKNYSILFIIDSSQFKLTNFCA